MCVDLIDDSPNKAKASGPLGSILTFGRHVVVTDSDLNPNAFQGTPCRQLSRYLSLAKAAKLLSAKRCIFYASSSNGKCGQWQLLIALSLPKGGR